jgi:hypothetical protein
LDSALGQLTFPGHIGEIQDLPGLARGQIEKSRKSPQGSYNSLIFDLFLKVGAHVRRKHFDFLLLGLFEKRREGPKRERLFKVKTLPGFFVGEREKLTLKGSPPQQISAASSEFSRARAGEDKLTDILLHQALDFIQKGRKALDLIDKDPLDGLVFDFLDRTFSEKGGILGIFQEGVFLKEVDFPNRPSESGLDKSAFPGLPRPEKKEGAFFWEFDYPVHHDVKVYCKSTSL